MGQVIDLAAARARRRPLAAAMERLDGAIGRLDPLVRSRGDRLAPALAADLRRSVTPCAPATPIAQPTRRAPRRPARTPAALGS